MDREQLIDARAACSGGVLMDREQLISLTRTPLPPSGKPAEDGDR